MGAKRRPFWVADCETDPFESDVLAIARRGCPECGVMQGEPCRELRIPRHHAVRPRPYKHSTCPECDAKPGKPCKIPRRSNKTHERRRRVPQPFIWGLYGGPSGDEYHEFNTPDELADFIERLPHLVYAHNGGKFDWHYLRHRINTGETISVIAGRLAKFRIGECECRDSMNILPVPLAMFEKQKIDYALMEPGTRDEPNNRAEIRKYLRSDCVNLHDLITAHRKENGVALTQAGASMRRWLKQSGQKRPRQSAHAFHYYKPYYYGGRVQCFAQGVRAMDFKVIDKNSAYPDAMLKEHPFSVRGAAMSDLPRNSNKWHHCLITLTCTARGCFPFRLGDDPTKGDLFFPEDERKTREYNVTGYEYMAALACNAIHNVTIKTVHYFEHVVNFREYIMEQWHKRARAKELGDKALDIICKLIMNSLYGKFASDYSKYREFMVCHASDFFEWKQQGWDIDAIWELERRLLSRLIPEQDNGRARYYNIATAASITGYVRADMYKGICAVSNPLYCDTDSISCGDVGRLPLGRDLGEWKDEGDFDWYAITGKKTYAFHKKGHPHTFELTDKGEYAHWKVASKGVDLGPDEIRAAAEGRTVIYSPQVPTYSVKRAAPVFIDRVVRSTARDIRIVPEHHA